jgi:hypothetical protein
MADTTTPEYTPPAMTQKFYDAEFKTPAVVPDAIVDTHATNMGQVIDLIKTLGITEDTVNTIVDAEVAKAISDALTQYISQIIEDVQKTLPDLVDQEIVDKASDLIKKALDDALKPYAGAFKEVALSTATGVKGLDFTHMDGSIKSVDFAPLFKDLVTDSVNDLKFDPATFSLLYSKSTNPGQYSTIDLSKLADKVPKIGISAVVDNATNKLLLSITADGVPATPVAIQLPKSGIQTVNGYTGPDVNLLYGDLKNIPIEIASDFSDRDIKNGARVLRYIAGKATTILKAEANHLFSFDLAANYDLTFDVFVNTTHVGTILFPANSSSGTLNLDTDVNLGRNDNFYITAPDNIEVPGNDTTGMTAAINLFISIQAVRNIQ